MLVRSSRRYLLRHPWLTVLSVLGVAVGVSVGVAVDLANTSALRAFALSGEAITGRATHQVVGGPGGIDASLYRELTLAGLGPAAPVVEGNVRAANDSARVLGVLGVDVFSEADFRPYIAPDGGGAGVDPAIFLTVSGAALLFQATADALGVAVGDTLPLRADGRPETAVVAGVLQPEDDRSASALANLLVVDVSSAQEWLGMEGMRGTRDSGLADRGMQTARDSDSRADTADFVPSVPQSLSPQSQRLGQLSRIDLIAPESGEEAFLARVQALLPEGVEVKPAAAQAETLATMTAAFRLNLSALSLLALVVGLFLIYNTVTFAVVQRRQVLGTYRALGVTRGETFRLVLGEALAIGAVGTVIGVALGVALGSVLVRLVTQTITDLYFVVRVRELDVSMWSLAKGVALGLGATLLGALGPGWEASSTEPATALRRSTTEDGLARRSPYLALAGVAAFAVGGLVLLVPAGVGGGYLGLLFLIGGVALVTPWLTQLYAAAARPVMRRLFGPVGSMAARGITANLSRTAVAVAALAVAVSATVGVTTMVTSFRTTVVEWLGSVLQADVYISPPPTVFRRGGAILDDGLYQQISALPGVARTDAIRVRTLDTDSGPVDLVVGQVDSVRTGIYRFKAGDASTMAQSARDGSVLVSEPYAFRFDTAVGDTLMLPTDSGARPFPVAGIYYDYGNDLGVVLMDEDVFFRHYRDPGRTGVALTAEPGVDPETLVQAVLNLADGTQEVQVRSNRALRETSLAIFDRTFLVTQVLRLLAIGVAFIGVLSALMALQLERRRELAMLRAQGLTPRELRGMVVLQTALMGLWAGVLAVPVGLMLAAVLVFVVNVRSFGWTLAFVVSPTVLWQAVALSVAAALLAGAYPAWKMGRADPAQAMREG